MAGADLLADLKAGGKRALADALARIERVHGQDAEDADLAALLDAAFAGGEGHVLGLTGPPGVGKSTLTNALVRGWREKGLTVGVIAVDPSSRTSGGALLGDRTRIQTDPEDQGVFVRSMAARDRLGGLSALSFPAAVLMRAVFDRVIVETVGVGQSETEIADLADTVAMCIQPGSGDSLQFMKAGIMEVPDIVVVTKADMGAAATRARADVEGALSLAAPGAQGAGWRVPVLVASAATGDGVAAILDAVEAHRTHDPDGRRARRTRQAATWIQTAVRERFGREGVRRMAPPEAPRDGPFTRAATLFRTLGSG